MAQRLSNAVSWEKKHHVRINSAPQKESSRSFIYSFTVYTPLYVSAETFAQVKCLSLKN